MFYYRIGSILALFEIIDESKNKWKLTIYKIGIRGGWNVLGVKSKIYKTISSKNPISHFQELKLKIKNKSK